MSILGGGRTSAPLEPATPSATQPGLDDLTVLAASAASGGPGEVDELMGRVRLLAHRYCRARLSGFPGGRDLADDVAQEVCLAVLRSLPRYRDRGRPFEAFVHGVASRKVADAQRAVFRGPQTLEVVPDTADEAPNPEEHAVFNSQLRIANELLDMLPRTLREVMVLRVVAGLTAAETGHALGMSPGAVRVAQHRAVTKMRSLLAESAETHQEVTHG